MTLARGWPDDRRKRRIRNWFRINVFVLGPLRARGEGPIVAHKMRGTERWDEPADQVAARYKRR